MRTAVARIEPVPADRLTPRQASLLAPFMARGPVSNIFRTLVQAPGAFEELMGWTFYILSRRNSLPGREREIVVLRIGYLCRSGYEWTQHAAHGLRMGLTEEEVSRIKLGPEAPGWSEADTALLRASDELHRDQFVTDSTWAALNRHFSSRQCMDVVFTAGQYTQISMMLNTFGVQLDEGQTLDPDLLVL